MIKEEDKLFIKCLTYLGWIAAAFAVANWFFGWGF